MLKASTVGNIALRVEPPRAAVADLARDVARIAPSRCKPPPPIVEQGANGFVESLVQLDGRPILILDFAKVTSLEGGCAITEGW